MRHACAAVVVLALLTACGPFIQVVRVADLPPEKQTALNAVRFYEAAELAKLSYEVVGEVTGNSCRNLLWDPSPSREDAVNQMRYWALERGANGLAEVHCEEPGGFSLATNCWESLTCKAKALRVKTAR
ncbi:MAG: Rcs stress response system protein RcsF [Burkholderiales bacterium]